MNCRALAAANVGHLQHTKGDSSINMFENVSEA